MQRMSDAELIDIIDERYRDINLNITHFIKKQIIDLCQGMPGFAHLAGREAALSSIARKSRDVDEFDYKQSIKESVRTSQESIINAYKKATYSPKENIYDRVLLACALAKRDEQGKFSASSIRDALREKLGISIEIAGFSRHLAAFCDTDRGAVLRKTGKPRRFQYQFIDAPLQPYIVMVGKRDGLI